MSNHLMDRERNTSDEVAAADPEVRSSPGWTPRDGLVLWHLLSLDAPSVAALWTVFVAASVHLSLPHFVPGAMFLAVWMLYMADRLLDSRDLPQSAGDRPPARDQLAYVADDTLEARHYFHHRHRRLMLVLLVVCAIALAALLPLMDPEAIRLDLLLGSLLFAYFVLIHATRSAHRLPKEISVGVFFSAAICVPTIARLPSMRLHLLPLALMFAVLCSVNCLFIYRWEHPPMEGIVRSAGAAPHRLTRVALGSLTRIAVTLGVASLALSFALRQPAMLAISAAACLLVTLDRHRSASSALMLRAAADLVLLTPVPFLLLGHSHV